MDIYCIDTLQVSLTHLEVVDCNVVWHVEVRPVSSVIQKHVGEWYVEVSHKCHTAMYIHRQHWGGGGGGGGGHTELRVSKSVIEQHVWGGGGGGGGWHVEVSHKCDTAMYIACGRGGSI